jgi:hypothetical protein
MHHATIHRLAARVHADISIYKLYWLCILTSAFIFLICNVGVRRIDVLWPSLLLFLVTCGLFSLIYVLRCASSSFLIALVIFAGFILISLQLYPYISFILYAILLFCFLILCHKLISISYSRALFPSALFSSIAVLASPSYAAFDILHKIESGNILPDILFHSSIASMIKSYGVPSTGLNGLVPISYHVFSHYFYASISLISNVSVIEVYGILTLIFTVPLLFLAFSEATVSLIRPSSLSFNHLWIVSSVLFSLSPFLLWRWNFSNSYFVSESYALSLSFLFAAYPLLFKHLLAPADYASIFLAVPLMSGLKGPTGIIFFLLLNVKLFIVDKKLSLATATFSLLIASSLYFTVFNSFSSASSSEGVSIGLFHFIETYSFLGHYLFHIKEAFGGHSGLDLFSVFAALLSLASFFLFHFYATFLVLVLNKPLTLLFPAVLGVSLPVLYTSVVLFLSFLTVMFLAIPGSSAIYITNLSFALSAPFLCIFICRWSQGTHPAMIPISCLILLLLFATRPSFLEHLSLSTQQTSTSQLVSQLRTLRSNGGLNIVFEPGESLPANPVSSCWVQPFLYPAISERAWTRIAPPTPGCFYRHFGFSDYGVHAEGEGISAQATLPPNFKGQIFKVPKEQLP